MNDDLTDKEKEEKESVKESSSQNKLEGLLTGVSKIFGICSEMLSNEETYREYEGEIEKENDVGPDMKGLYKLGIKMGELGKKTEDSPELRSIPPSKYPPPKINVEDNGRDIIVKIAFKNIIKEEMNLLQKESLVIKTQGGTENSKELEFSQEDYRIKEIEYKFPDLIITLTKLSERGD
ncbi:hypothetical protein JCM16358_01880 [Halanaerocella petrolearia]